MGIEASEEPSSITEQARFLRGGPDNGDMSVPRIDEDRVAEHEGPCKIPHLFNLNKVHIPYL